MIVPILAGGVTGALLCLVPALLKAKLNASEMVASLMLNYVALYLGLFSLNSFLRDQSFGALATDKLPEVSKLSKIIRGTSVHSGVFIAALFIVLCYLLVFKTKLGEQIRIYGQNPVFAKYTGMKVGSVIIISQLLGGMIAGIGGSVELMGMYDRFQWTSLPGYGWNGIILAPICSACGVIFCIFDSGCVYYGFQYGYSERIDYSNSGDYDYAGICGCVVEGN